MVVGDLEDSRILFRKLTKKPLPWLGPPRTMACSAYLIDSHKELLLVQEIISNPFYSWVDVMDFVFDKKI